MADLLLIASVGTDRIRWLHAPLRPGARLRWHRSDLRAGGGGFNTGVPLAALGHRVRLSAVLHDDARGRRLLADLDARGIDTALVTMLPGESPITDILVEPDGERTLIFPPVRSGERPAPDRLEADLVYVNARALPAVTAAALARHPMVVAQFPLDAAMAQPAHVLIGSRSDFPEAAPEALFAEGRARAGARFRTLVLTDGALAVTVVEDGKTTELAVVPVAAADTTGAGDVFAAGLIDGLVRGEPTVAAARRGIALAGDCLSRCALETA